MLKLSLYQFRCWENISFKIPLNGITLIKGDSGAGKSTIFHSLDWCLFGKMRLVAPNHLESSGIKAKTSVTIEFPHILNGSQVIIQITRQKNPNRLLLNTNDISTTNSTTYEDKVAQSLIEDIFGSYDIWLASCYIGQGCRNSFLTAPNNGKMELLNSIAFHEEDPQIYIDKIDVLIANTDTTYKTLLTKFTTKHNLLQQYLSDIDITRALTPDQIELRNSHIQSLTDKLSSLRKIKAQRDIDMAILSKLQQQLSKIIITSVITPSPKLLTLNTLYQGQSLDTTCNIEHDIEQLLTIIPLLKQRDKYQSELHLLSQKLIPNSMTYTLSDYQETIEKEILYQTNYRLAKSLGVNYDSQSIGEAIEKYRKILAMQEDLKIETKRKSLVFEIDRLMHCPVEADLVFPEVVEKQIVIPDFQQYSVLALSHSVNELAEKQGAIKAHISHLELGCDVLQCPHCQGSVRYRQGTLVISDMDKIDCHDITSEQQRLKEVTSTMNKINSEIQALRQAETNARTQYEMAVKMERHRLDSLREKLKQLEFEQQRRDIQKQARIEHIRVKKEELDKLPEKNIDLSTRILTGIEGEQMQGVISKLETIILVQAVAVGSQEIKMCLDRQEVEEKIEKIKRLVSELKETIALPFREAELGNVQNYLDEIRSYLRKMRINFEERQFSIREKLSLEEQIAGINIESDPGFEMDKINLEMGRVKHELELSEKAWEVINFQSVCVREREIVVGINAELADLQALRQHAVEAEAGILQEIVDSINSSIQGVCSTLFDRDINIELSLFKTLKTTKHVKSEVNFNILYQGGKFDNIQQMSGGEGDRASLALTLSLNRLSSCPLLMLDESLASLDLNMKESALKAVREQTNNATLIIMHDGVEGVFDHCIDINELRELFPLA